MIKNTIWLIACFFILTGLINAGEIELSTDIFSLKFASDGRAASLKKLDDGRELLNIADPGDAFFINDAAGHKIRFSYIRLEDERLILDSENKTQQITLKVTRKDKYLHFAIEHIKGIPVNSGLMLGYEMNTISGIYALNTDYMTQLDSRSGQISVKWEYLWNRNTENPLGSFALYCADDEDGEDDILLRIWADGFLPHPKVDGQWDYQRARRWVEQWQNMFSDQSQFVLEADNLQDLYAGVKYAELAGAKQIYLFTNTWRGGFWPTDQVNWDLRKDVFPNGEKDMRQYSDHLISKGIYLKLHYLSGSLGFQDPVYVSDKPDKRLATWGSGKLSTDVDNSSSTLYFVPDKGVQLPCNVSPGFNIIPPMLDSVHGYNNMRIGDEIILVGSFEQTDTDKWKLVNCKRGMYNTKAVQHSSSTEMAGLIDTYGQNFLPENDSDLLREIAELYAGFCNRTGVYNVEFDGFESHAYHGVWAAEKFASLVYQTLDHPCTSGSSAGRVPWAWIEYKFNSTKRLMKGFRFNVHCSYKAPLILDSPGREATNPLEAHYELSQGAAACSPAFGLSKPQPMFGLTVKELETYGLTNEVADIVKSWKVASRFMTDKQRETINSSFMKNKSCLPDSSQDNVSEYVYILDSDDKNTYRISPVKILTRETVDADWQSWQEHGPIAPKQFIKPEQSLRLNNPFGSQKLNFIIRVLYALDYNSFDNIDIQPLASDIKNAGDIRLSSGESGLELSYDNDRNIPIWQSEGLPGWVTKAVDMSCRRAVGMNIEGDGSNSIVVFQIPGMDYVVRLDFKGRRYIEIPNGQAAWANGYWGWRIGTHRSSYDNVDKFSLGFGYVPAQTRTRAQISGLKILKEKSAVLIDPVITTSTGKLEIQGYIESGNYLKYDGGANAVIYDKNWNKLRVLAVKDSNFTIVNGLSDVSIGVSNKEDIPWLEVQFLTKGEVMTVNTK